MQSDKYSIAAKQYFGSTQMHRVFGEHLECTGSWGFSHCDIRRYTDGP